MRREDVAFGERAAAHYESWYETPHGRHADIQEKAALGSLLDGFASAGDALEVGCGTGHFTRWLRERGCATVGLDISSAMLAQAHSLNADPCVRGDACRLPFRDGSFDLVAFITTLEFLGQPKEALSEALRVARQGLLLGVLNRCSKLGLQRRVVGLFRATTYDTARFLSLAEVRHMVRAVAGNKAHITWRNALLPRGWPRALTGVPWGGFIGMAVVLEREPRVTE